jgi:hypothetical protein
MTYPSYRNIVVRGDAWNQGVTSYTLRLADGKIRFDLFQASGSYTGIYSNTVMSTGAWHHIAAVYDGSQMRIYLDGQLDCSQAFTWTPPAFSTIFRIGRETNYNFPYNYSGLVDEVRVSSGALYTSNFSPQATLSVETTTKGLWKFDEQTANDATNSNNGTLYGAGATYSTDVPTAPSTPSDNSLWLDGTNSYLEASSPAGSSLDIRGPFTLEAWVKNSADTTYPNYRSILVRGDNWNLGVSSFLFRLSDGKLRFDMYQASGSYTGFYSNTVMSTGVWHHVAAVYDGSQMKIYLDGQLDGLQSFTWDPPVISTIFRVGRETNINFPFSYSGLIDEVRVSSGVLYTSNFTPQKHLTSQASTKGLWKFDGQTANDSSGNGNGGTLNGNATYSTDAPTP